MKLSVSVPDELWDQARRRVDDDSASAVIQAALTRFVGDGVRSDYALRPVLDADLAAQIEAARAHIVDDAREMFQQGYRDGVRLAGQLSFRQLDYIARSGSLQVAKSMAQFKLEIDTGRADVPDGARPLIDPNMLVDYLGSYADYTGGSIEWTPSRPTIEGIDRALSDVWDRVDGHALAGSELG